MFGRWGEGVMLPCLCLVHRMLCLPPGGLNDYLCCHDLMLTIDSNTSVSLDSFEREIAVAFASLMLADLEIVHDVDFVVAADFGADH